MHVFIVNRKSIYGTILVRREWMGSYPYLVVTYYNLCVSDKIVDLIISITFKLKG